MPVGGPAGVVRRGLGVQVVAAVVEHTNLAKHRMPAVAMVRLGSVHTWPLGDPNIIVGTSGAPLTEGSVIATGPLYKRVPVDIWSMVAIRRPHTGEWNVVMKELGALELEEWVREVAIPVLVTGDSGQTPLPPEIDTTTGWDNVREAIRVGGAVPAIQRSQNRIVANGGRDNIAETLALHPQAVEAPVIEQWLDGLKDEEVIAQLDALAAAAKRGPWDSEAACRDMIRQATEADARRVN